MKTLSILIGASLSFTIGTIVGVGLCTFEIIEKPDLINEVFCKHDARVRVVDKDEYYDLFFAPKI